MDKNKIKRLANYAISECTQHSEDGSWSISYDELYHHFGADVSDTNQNGKLLEEELRQREEINELIMTEDCIEMTCHLEYCEQCSNDPLSLLSVVGCNIYDEHESAEHPDEETPQTFSMRRRKQMIIQAELECKRSDFRTQSCSIDKVIELSPAEFAEFLLRPFDCYSFIDEFNAENHKYKNNSYKNNSQPCLLVLGEHENDGILIDPQGYNYARYSTYIPNARSLIWQERYPALNSFADEMRYLADEYVKKAVSGQIDCQYRIDLNAIERQCRHAGFSEELFTDMLSDRPEIEDIEAIDGYCIVTIAEPYLRQDDEQSLRKLTSEEVEIMCAKHILWIHDAGGEQADFSNCLLADLDLSRKNLINAVLDGAKLQNVKLQDAELCFASCIGTKFYNCDLTNVVAEEADFKNAECMGSDFDKGIFTHSNFTGTRFMDCSMNNGSLQNCCLDGTDFGDMYLGSTNTNGCSHDEQYWSAEWDGSLAMNGGNA